MRSAKISPDIDCHGPDPSRSDPVPLSVRLHVMSRLYVQLVHSSATHLSKLSNHMVLLTNTSCMQSADQGPAYIIPQCIGAVQARNLDKKVHSFLAPKLARFLASNLQSSISKSVICVAEVISSVCMSVLLLKYQELSGKK